MCVDVGRSRRRVVHPATALAVAVLACCVVLWAQCIAAADLYKYTFVPGPLTYAEAKTRCENVNMWLATFKTSVEWNAAEKLMPAGGRAWAAGTDRLVNGQWTWDDGPDKGSVFYHQSSRLCTLFCAWQTAPCNVEPNDYGGTREDYLLVEPDCNKKASWNDLSGTVSALAGTSIGAICATHTVRPTSAASTSSKGTNIAVFAVIAVAVITGLIIVLVVILYVRRTRSKARRIANGDASRGTQRDAEQVMVVARQPTTTFYAASSPSSGQPSPESRGESQQREEKQQHREQQQQQLQPIELSGKIPISFAGPVGGGEAVAGTVAPYSGSSFAAGYYGTPPMAGSGYINPPSSSNSFPGRSMGSVTPPVVLIPGGREDRAACSTNSNATTPATPALTPGAGTPQIQQQPPVRVGNVGGDATIEYDVQQDDIEPVTHEDLVKYGQSHRHSANGVVGGGSTAVLLTTSGDAAGAGKLSRSNSSRETATGRHSRSSGRSDTGGTESGNQRDIEGANSPEDNFSRQQGSPNRSFGSMQPAVDMDSSSDELQARLQQQQEQQRSVTVTTKKSANSATVRTPPDENQSNVNPNRSYSPIDPSDIVFDNAEEKTT